MQIELSQESVCFILIMIYMLVAILAVIIPKGNRKYLKKSPNEEKGKEYFRHYERNYLSIGGFALSALALLVGLQFKELSQVSTGEQSTSAVLASTIQFFSLAFMLSIIAYVTLHFRIKNFVVYLADIFFNAGLISIGFGLMLFFVKNIYWKDGSEFIFAVFVIVLVIASVVNLILYDNYIETQRGEKNEQRR